MLPDELRHGRSPVLHPGRSAQDFVRLRDTSRAKDRLPWETVLDIGSGGGIDCFEASRLVGPTGHVIGIDMTDTMLAIARKNAPVVAANLGYTASNVEFRKGMADAIPVIDGAVDLIISNCVINLAPDKRKVFRKCFASPNRVDDLRSLTSWLIRPFRSIWCMTLKSGATASPGH